MRSAAHAAGLAVEIDSAGTGDWHVGRPPDPRAIATARRHGIDISGLRARQVTPADFDHFHHILALDANNISDLRRMRPDRSRASLSMLLDFADGRAGQDVADPYFGADEGFDVAWGDIAAGVDGLLAQLAAQPSG